MLPDWFYFETSQNRTCSSMLPDWRSIDSNLVESAGESAGLPQVCFKVWARSIMFESLGSMNYVSRSGLGSSD